MGSNSFSLRNVLALKIAGSLVAGSVDGASIDTGTWAFVNLPWFKHVSKYIAGVTIRAVAEFFRGEDTKGARYVATLANDSLEKFADVIDAEVAKVTEVDAIVKHPLCADDFGEFGTQEYKDRLTEARIDAFNRLMDLFPPNASCVVDFEGDGWETDFGGDHHIEHQKITIVDYTE